MDGNYSAINNMIIIRSFGGSVTIPSAASYSGQADVTIGNIGVTGYTPMFVLPGWTANPAVAYRYGGVNAANGTATLNFINTYQSSETCDFSFFVVYFKNQ